MDLRGIEPTEYIKFYGLRNHGTTLDEVATPVTEMVYVHSKCMIIDDRWALIGSANINDRSQHGNRDSELAVIIEDENKTKMPVGSSINEVHNFAHTLRV